MHVAYQLRHQLSVKSLRSRPWSDSGDSPVWWSFKYKNVGDTLVSKVDQAVFNHNDTLFSVTHRTPNIVISLVPQGEPVFSVGQYPKSVFLDKLGGFVGGADYPSMEIVCMEQDQLAPEAKVGMSERRLHTAVSVGGGQQQC